MLQLYSKITFARVAKLLLVGQVMKKI